MCLVTVKDAEQSPSVVGFQLHTCETRGVKPTDVQHKPDFLDKLAHSQQRGHPEVRVVPIQKAHRDRHVSALANAFILLRAVRKEAGGKRYLKRERELAHTIELNLPQRRAAVFGKMPIRVRCTPS